MSNLSEKQRAWLKKLGAVVNSGDGGGAEVAAPAEPHLITVSATATRKTQPAGPGGNKVATAAPAGDKAVAAGNKSDLVGIGIPGLLDPSITVKVTIINRSPFDLERASGSAKLENPTVCKFVRPPPAELPANSAAQTFEISNNSVPGFGCGGEVSYNIVDDDKKTSVFFKWERGFIPSRKHTEEVRPANAAKFSVTGDIVEDEFTFIFAGKGAPSPKPGPQPPGPQPGPAPAQDIKSSCNITVTNNTKLVLTLADQGHDRGDFVNFPPPTIQPGASAQFVSVETPHGKEQGCKGFVSWEVGSPSAAIWRCEWDNPEGDQNHAKAPAEPQSAGFRTLAQIGQDDENVPVVFTISGGGAGPAPQPGPSPQPQPGPQPGPAPGPAPEPEPAFNPPTGSRQPTLRKGDKSPDGWVEYMQQLLNLHLGANTVPVSGDFDQTTFNAVRNFQKKNKLQVDGTVGNQTWAALREDKPEAPSTDGRAPHTFEQKDLQARWEVEGKGDAVYLKSIDRLTLNVASVGEGKIDDFFATVKVTPPGTKSKVVKIKIGPPFSRTPDDQGNFHAVTLEEFKKKFPANDPNAKLEDYLIEAFFDKELGPDLFKGNITVQ
jgi:peptidoglycan hydrolase-like protein with peptidoglycan-binding domain